MTETELFFTDLLNCDRQSLYLNGNMALAADQARYISSVLKRRIAGEPIQYILGKAEFMGLEFKVDQNVLIPRPETEVLVETVIKYATRSGGHQVTSLNILDIGTGSGCIAVSLAKLLKDCKITAIDISQEAINIAQNNAILNNVDGKIDFITQDFFNWGPGTGDWGLFDFIVSNPPYIPSDEISKLQPEIQYEPAIALDGGEDGFDFYRRIIKESPKCLKAGGFLAMEIGFNQRLPLENIFKKSEKFKIIEIVKDYNNIERVIIAQIDTNKMPNFHE